MKLLESAWHRESPGQRSSIVLCGARSMEPCQVLSLPPGLEERVPCGEQASEAQVSKAGGGQV